MVRMAFAAALAGFMGVATVSAVAADKAGDGLKKGDAIGAFYVTKVAGATDDGVEQGQQLCYRCKYGSRPMVMVFARKTNDQVTRLVSELDEAVAEHDDAQLKGFLTLIGGEKGELKQQAEKLSQKMDGKNIPVVVAEDAENGPSSYHLDPKAEVTVVVADDNQVVAKHTFKAAEVDVAAVMKDVEKMLN